MRSVADFKSNEESVALEDDEKWGTFGQTYHPELLLSGLKTPNHGSGPTAFETTSPRSQIGEFYQQVPPLLLSAPLCREVNEEFLQQASSLKNIP